MPKNYLDLHGLTLYDGEIKDYIDVEANEIIEKTSAEYDQLSYAEKHNGKYYHITDRNGSATLDANVGQAESSDNADYEVLLSNSASTTTEISGVKKSAGLKFNPSTGDLTVSDINTPSGETWDGTNTSLKDAIANAGGGGSELATISLPDYNRLTPAQKNDGIARFVPHNDLGETSDLDCTDITGYYENNSVMNVVSASSSEIDITWNGGIYIGCNFKFNQAIDVTNWDKIVFDVTTGSCYGNGETAQRQDWYLQIGLLTYSITSAINLSPSSLDWKALNYFYYSNTDYGTVEIDVSTLTGTYYLTCVCHGWNATIENMKLATLGGYSSQIKYMGETFGEQVVFEGATTINNGTSGLVPRPLIADKDKYLKGDGTWGTVSASDINVAQSVVSTDSNDYELIFSGTADNTTRTEGVGKNNTLKCNPSTGNISVSSVTISGTVTNNTDAATKQYVDNLIDTAITQVIEAGY